MKICKFSLFSSIDRFPFFPCGSVPRAGSRLTRVSSENRKKKKEVFFEKKTNRSKRKTLFSNSSLFFFIFKHFLFIGMTGFEPATPCSQSICATKLRYIPFFFLFWIVSKKEKKNNRKRNRSLSYLRDFATSMKKRSTLFDDVRHDTCTDSTTPFTNSKTHSFFDSHRVN